MLRFIRRENVKHYRQLLEQTTDQAERQRIMKLIAEEEKKQRDSGDDNAEKPAAKQKVTF